MKILREIVRNTQMGIEAIDNLMSYVECDRLKQTMGEQREVLKEFSDQAKSQLTCEEIENAKGTKLEKTMVKAGTAMNAMLNRNSSHIAEMLIDGYNMGLVSVQKCVNELKEGGCNLPPVAADVTESYEKFIKELREYL